MPQNMVFGMLNGMNFKIDRAGRVVLPKPVRERWGLHADTELELIERPDGLLLKPVESAPAMVKVDGLWVHQGTALSNARWDVIDQVRDERTDAVVGF